MHTDILPISHAFIPKHQLEVNQKGEFVTKSRIMCINSYHPVAAVSSDDIPVSPLPMTSVSLVSTDISLSSPSISNNHVLASSHTSLSFPLLSDVSGRNLDSSDHEPPVIDDPELLLNLISSGQIDVISDSNTDTHESIWSSEIENMTNESFFLLFDVNQEKSCNFPSLNHEHGSSAGKAKYGKQETGKT